MRTVVHISLILLIGIGLGFGMRSIRSGTKRNGPPPGEAVYSNDPATAVEVVIEKPEPIKPPEGEQWLSRFELTERSGKKVTSEELLGQPYVVSFFFSTCPSICVKQNQKIKELQDLFQGEGVRFVAISVDPKTDTPEVLREYAARFGADEQQWLFMTGDLTYVRRVAGEVFKLHADEQVHSEKFVLVDPSGEIEGMYYWPDEKQYQKLQESIRSMLKSAKS